MRHYKKYYWLFLAPTLIAFLIAFVIPFFMGVYLSFTEWQGTFLDAKFIGLVNYKEAFHDERFRDAFWFTAKFSVVSVILINIVAFSLALLLTRGIKGTNLFRTVFFMPNLIGGIVLGYIWQVIIYSILDQFNLALSMDPKYGFWGLVIVMNWQMAGYMMIIYIAAIQNIPKELIEAAEMDGANSSQKVKNIIIPSVMPAVTICLFLTLSNSFKLYDQNLSLTNGDPNFQTAMLALDIVSTFYNRMNFGMGQAKAVMFLLLVGVLTLTQVFITSRKEVEA